MRYPITTKAASPLSIVARGAVRGALWAPRKIVKAMKLVKAAASNLIERVRSAMDRRPSRTVQAQPPLVKLENPSGERAPKPDPVIDCLWDHKKSVQVSSDLAGTHQKFLEEFGHRLSVRETNGLTNAIQHPESYSHILDGIIVGLEQNRRK